MNVKRIVDLVGWAVPSDFGGRSPPYSDVSCKRIPLFPKEGVNPVRRLSHRAFTRVKKHKNSLSYLVLSRGLSNGVNTFPLLVHVLLSLLKRKSKLQPPSLLKRGLGGVQIGGRGGVQTNPLEPVGGIKSAAGG